MMSSSIDQSSRVGVTLDLILKTLVASAEFNLLQSKNWEAIARLIPGTTPEQCSKRYEELISNENNIMFAHLGRQYPGSRPLSSSRPVSQSESETSSKSSTSRPSSGKQKGIRDEKEVGARTKGKTSTKSSSGNGPLMVIHVCDEAKNLRQDFHCPRDLLVREMQYFAEYLSTDSQRLEEVDISVHCDVQIFDWLMKYTKRGTKESSVIPKLEASNVISILISSDFLKMANLVTECIEYCHKNMSAIVATPCNMNCINDKLVTRIADLFSHNEADDIRDRKDKFKSKIFTKKLEKLFNPEEVNPDSPELAATIFRCSICKKLLTKPMEKKVKCLQSRMTVDKQGSLIYCHVRDKTFDINDYLLEQKAQLKSWRDVYWRVWGIVNYRMCSRCLETFSCSELGHCKYHPEMPRFDTEEGMPPSSMGMYPCCHQKTLRFDPTQQTKGCRVRDHIVILNQSRDVDKDTENKVYDDLLAHREAACMHYQRTADQVDQELNLFANEIFVRNSDSAGAAIPQLCSIGEVDKKSETTKPQPRLQALTIEKEVTFEPEDDFMMGESDDEIGDDEQIKPKKTRSLRKSRVTIDPQAILLDAPEFEQTKKSTWDAQRSTRHNQDAQRQEDMRRMNEIRMYLTRLRLNPDKLDRSKHKEYSGGIYSRLENQWKMSYLQTPKQLSQQQLRSKARLVQIRNTNS